MRSNNLTDLLACLAGRGIAAAFDEIAPLIYDELRRLASFHLRGERPGHTFSPTDLISEAYLRLVGGAALEFHQSGALLRHRIAEHAPDSRRPCAEANARGEAWRRARPTAFDEMLVVTDRPWELVALDDAAGGSRPKFDERKARVTELHYFGGLTTRRSQRCAISMRTRISRSSPQPGMAPRLGLAGRQERSPFVPEHR